MRRRRRRPESRKSAGCPIHRFRHEAMTTVFEVFLPGNNEKEARGAAGALFDEIDRIESLLSRFDPRSDVSQIGFLKRGETMRIAAETMDCLLMSLWLADATDGAFDVTVGRLMDRWRKEENEGQAAHIYREPSEEELEEARKSLGWEGLKLTPERFEVTRVATQGRDEIPPVEIDLGGIGKGFALDRAVEFLGDWGFDDALLHAGASTALAVGCHPKTGPANGRPGGWSVGVGGPWGEKIGKEKILLRDGALSGSGTEVKGDHILDPQTGYPTSSHRAAWATAPSAAVADGLSTAFMVLSTEAVRDFCRDHPDVGAFVVPLNPDDAPVDLLRS